MLVANSFDLWQRDTFFSAAEEVQQSADIMESAYKTWLRAKREGLIPKHLDELERELQMALGTAKWQLEEFEKAIRVSYRNNGDENKITRHRLFVSAMKDQIYHVETALRQSFNLEGKKKISWVNLDKKEYDDLALFLSGPETSVRKRDESINVGATLTKESKDYSSLVSEVIFNTQTSNQGISYQTEKIDSGDSY